MPQNQTQAQITEQLEQKRNEVIQLKQEIQELNADIEAKEQGLLPKDNKELARKFYVDRQDGSLKNEILGVIEKIKQNIPSAQDSIRQKQEQINTIVQQIQEKQALIESKEDGEEKQNLQAELIELNNTLNSLKEEQALSLAPQNPADLSTKSYVDKELLKLLTQLQSHIQDANTKDRENVKLSGNQSIGGVKSFSGDVNLNGITNIANPRCPSNPINDNGLARKAYVDYGGGMMSLGNQTNPRINLSLSQHFHFTMTGRGNIGVSNWGGYGKSGTITIYRAENITGFLAPFAFRVLQSGFRGTETFAYFCVSPTHIKLTRV